MEKWSFSAKVAIVEMRCDWKKNYKKNDLQIRIDYLTRLLANEDMRMQVIKEELLEIKKIRRRSRSNIEYTASDFRIEDIISDEM